MACRDCLRAKTDLIINGRLQLKKKKKLGDRSGGCRRTDLRHK